jgi:P4 family phage/plasmid primase-like protien
MIQVRMIRERTTPKKGKDGSIILRDGKPIFDKYDAPLTPPMEVETLHDLFQSVDKLVEKIPENERFNLYYTIGHMPETSDGRARRWNHQDVIPFDIDNIHYVDDLPNPKYMDAISEALQVDLAKCVVVATGNGVQVLVKPKYVISDRNYFDQNKKYYLALSHKIAETLSKYGLAGSLDASAFEPNRLFRLPQTLNRKPNRPERVARILRGDLQTVDWDLVTASGLPLVSESDEIPEKSIRRVRVDAEAVEAGCEFLKWSKENQNKVSEPQWYAMLSIVGRLPGGDMKAHEYSKASAQYSSVETSDKLYQAVNASGPRTCDNINKLWGKCASCPNYQKVGSPIMLKGPNFIASLDSGFHFFNNKGVAIPQFVDLLKYYEQKNTFINVSKKHYIFAKNKWEMCEENDVKAFSQEHFEPACNNHKASEFHGIVSRTNVERPSFFTETTKRKLNFENGILNLDSGVFTEPSPSVGFLWTLPYKYDPIAQAPMFEQFLDDFTQGDDSKKRILQEYMGYCVSGDEPRAQKFLTLVGDGSNGKSTFLEIMTALVGGEQSQAVSALSLTDLARQFERTRLMGALFNVMDESETYIDGSVWEKLKNLVTGGLVDAAFKGKDSFQFHNKAKFIMLVNEIPKGANPNKGFYRRFLIVPCTAVFEGKKVDRFIKDRIIAEELPGIMNFALKGYQRLLEQGYQFTESQAAHQALEEYKQESNRVAAWCEETLDLERESGAQSWHVSNGSGKLVASTHGLRLEFNAWLRDRDEKEYTATGFGKKLLTWLKDKGYDMSGYKYAKVDGKAIMCLENVWAKESSEEPPAAF